MVGQSSQSWRVCSCMGNFSSAFVTAMSRILECCHHIVETGMLPINNQVEVWPFIMRFMCPASFDSDIDSRTCSLQRAHHDTSTKLVFLHKLVNLCTVLYESFYDNCSTRGDNDNLRMFCMVHMINIWRNVTHAQPPLHSLLVPFTIVFKGVNLYELQFLSKASACGRLKLPLVAIIHAKGSVASAWDLFVLCELRLFYSLIHNVFCGTLTPLFFETPTQNKVWLYFKIILHTNELFWCNQIPLFLVNGSISHLWKTNLQRLMSTNVCLDRVHNFELVHGM